jgi:hypothetical protein
MPAAASPIVFKNKKREQNFFCSSQDYWFFFTFLLLVGWDFWYCGNCWPVIPAPDDRWWWLWRNRWSKDWQGKLKYTGKTYPSATLSTTNATRLDPGLNPSRRSRKPATNRLSNGMAFFFLLYLSSAIPNNTTFWKQDLFPSSGERMGGTCFVGPFSASLNHWTWS